MNNESLLETSMFSSKSKKITVNVECKNGYSYKESFKVDADQFKLYGFKIVCYCNKEMHIKDGMDTVYDNDHTVYVKYDSFSLFDIMIILLLVISVGYFIFKI